jgi:hypothetical protein
VIAESHNALALQKITMKKILNHILKRKVSTERVDNLPSGVAMAALDKRVQHFMDGQASQGAPQPRSFAELSNPLQKS